MCLAIPGRIASIEAADPVLRSGRVHVGGIVQVVNLSCVPEARVGDYVLVHAGLALHTLDQDEAEQVLDCLHQMSEIEDLGHEPSSK